MQRRPHLGRYLLWQLRDYLMQQAPATAIVLCLFGYLTIVPLARSAGGPSAALPAAVHQHLLSELLASFVLLGTLFATNGIVATDRKQGFYRFIFAKPVSAPRFYLNAFVANGLGMLLVGLVLLGLYSLFIRPSWSQRFVPVIAAMYVAYGGIGFLLSTVWRYDWLSLVTVAVVASVGWDMWGDDPGIRGWLMHLLPPTHKAGEVYAYVAGVTSEFPWLALAWLTSYGLVCFLLGLVVLRHRSLAAT